MTIEEALRILGVTNEDDDKTIKLKFRKLIARFHPDAVGSDRPEHIKKAQLLNEAYAVLRKRSLRAEKYTVKRPVWKGKVIERAFAERTIYMSGVSWEGEMPEYYEVARGRYEWDPNLEEFECLLRSLNEVVMDLLGKAEWENGIYNDYEYDIKSTRFGYQIELFHLLAGQFIAPLSSLKKLAEPEMTDESGREIYRFQAFLGEKGSSEAFRAMAKLKEGDLVYATSLKHNRIMVSDETGVTLGHLSLADDHLYYVIIPIVQNHLAQVKFVVRESDIHKNCHPYRIKVNVDMYLRMKGETEEIESADHNLRIVEVLNRYDAELRRITR